MARGLDISNITHVINFEMPEMPIVYAQIGRTGRADASRNCHVSFIAPQEEFKVGSEVLMNMELAIELSRNKFSSN
jgi:ATP-dependent RNA helicase RhlE